MKLISVLCVSLCLCSCGKATDPKEVFHQGDYEKSLQLWMPLAKAGDKEAQDYIGIQYYMGLGVNRDYKEAIKWFEPAARAGYPDAQRNYGDMLQYGHGVPQDNYQAFIWYFAASQQGHETAKVALANITDNNKLTPNQQMHAKLEANKYIPDPAKHFMSHDTYIEK